MLGIWLLMILTCFWPPSFQHKILSRPEKNPHKRDRGLTLKLSWAIMTVNICDNNVLDGIIEWSAGCLEKVKTVICNPRECYGVRSCLPSIQQHNCGEHDGLLINIRKASQWPGRLQHVTSEERTLLHSGFSADVLRWRVARLWYSFSSSCFKMWKYHTCSHLWMYTVNKESTRIIYNIIL